MSPLVERVTNSFPQVQRTVATAYSGWISVFMVPLSLGRPSTRYAQHVSVLIGLVDLVERVRLGGDQLARGARRSRERGGRALTGRECVHRHRAERLAVARERDRELPRVPAPGVLHHRDVAVAELDRGD